MIVVLPDVSTVPDIAVPCIVTVAVAVDMVTSPPNSDTLPDSYVNEPTLTVKSIATSIGTILVSNANSSMIVSVFGPIVNFVPSTYDKIIPPSSPVWRKSFICNSYPIITVSV